jgi:hypothetical protein
MDTGITKIVDLVQPTLSAQESMVRITLAEPMSAYHADYFRRYKVTIGKIAGDANSVSDVRCVVVSISSNTGDAKIESSTTCDSIRDVG